ncbi:MAG: PepSY-associated TM helix domain-containing protein [Gemmatimonadota bacterium]|nr:PepSY-associated TM helix domain-containing protein [Gemmatimonadota bacterium]
MFRKVLFRLHLSVAVAVGLFIVTMAVTGAVIAGEDALMSLAERRRSVAVPEGLRRRPPDDLVAAAEKWGAEGGVPFTATSIEYGSRPDAAVQVHAGRDRRVFVNPWTGEVVGGGFPFLEGFFDGVRGWHRWLGVSGAEVRTGRAVTGAANVAFLFLLLTGPLLWIPRPVTRRTLAENLLLRRCARGPGRQLNLHLVIGIWSVAPLVLISATGVVMSYPAVGDRVYAVVGALMPGGAGVGEDVARTAPSTAVEARGDRVVPDGQGGLAGALAAAGATVPGWRGIVLAVPRPDDERMVAEVRTGRAGQPQKASVVTVDRGSGAVLSLKSFRDEPRSHRAQELLRHAHTGEYWGLAGQLMAGVFALATVAMAWTGFSVVLVMLRLRRSKRRFGARHPPAAKQ